MEQQSMMQEYDNKTIRACIDKAFDAGYAEATRKAADWLYEHLANSDRIPMANWNKEFWKTAFIGYMNDR